ncbi:MAG: hypothetical protein IPI67_13145 [Myxococcales bacterium]|nr:hypothetical protein [Myxococcales bacterium]
MAPPIVVLGLCGGIETALAAPIGYDLDYRADEGCLDHAGFVAQIAARARDAEHAPGRGEQMFVVRIIRSGEEWQGQVELWQDESPRGVTGATCDSVAKALALIVAVALDPTIALDLSQPPSVPSDAPLPRALEPDSDNAPERVPEVPRGGTMGLFGAGGVVSSGPAPRTLYGAHLFGELGVDGRAGPGFRATISRASTGVRTLGSGAARFVLTTGRFDACPAAIQTGDLLLTGCASVEGGVIQAEGLARGDLQSPDSVTRPWFELGVATRFSWVLADRYRLELFGGAAAPLTRRAYVFENPREVVHEPPLLVGRAGFGFSAETR